MYGEIVAHYAAQLASWPQLDEGMGVTWEHGVGLLKRAGLRAELSPAVLETHRPSSAPSTRTTS